MFETFIQRELDGFSTGYLMGILVEKTFIQRVLDVFSTGLFNGHPRGKDVYST